MLRLITSHAHQLHPSRTHHIIGSPISPNGQDNAIIVAPVTTETSGEDTESPTVNYGTVVLPGEPIWATHRQIDALLQKGPGCRRDGAEGCRHHRHETQEHPCDDTLACDPHRATADRHRVRDPIEPIDSGRASNCFGDIGLISGHEPHLMNTAPLTITPRRAARETPDTSATGAARMSGQGVATTNTASARTASPDTSQASVASSSVSGSSSPAYLSAIR